MRRAWLAMAAGVLGGCSLIVGDLDVPVDMGMDGGRREMGAAVDMAAPDLAMPDLAPPPDLAEAPDLGATDDMGDM